MLFTNVFLFHTARRQKAQHAGEGFAFGIRDFGKGVFKGVTGLVSKPVSGAKHGGVKGLFKGLGKGVAGLVVKPVVGAVDLVSRTAEGIGNTGSYFAKKGMTRVRAPRHIDEDRVLRVRVSLLLLRGMLDFGFTLVVFMCGVGIILIRVLICCVSHHFLRIHFGLVFVGFAIEMGSFSYFHLLLCCCANVVLVVS